LLEAKEADKHQAMTQRQRFSSVLRLLGGLTLLVALTARAGEAQTIEGVDTSKWHGFNLLEKFTARGNAPFREDDFKWISELGFNFVRLPLDYRCYTDTNDWLKFKEEVLKDIDQAIEFGARHHIHVCLNLHRAPGFCINPPNEPTDLWTNAEAQRAFAAHWEIFARRYKQVPSERLSFNLLNEPTRNTRETYLAVFSRTIEAIQKVDPNRFIIVDGNNVGKDPSAEFLRYSNVIQSTRGYHPGAISHYRANWVNGSDRWPVPTWPQVKADGSPATANPGQTLIDYLKPWVEIAARGETVFVGEWGSFNRTPHPVALAWMRAWLDQWKQAGFGWALWNFRGSFGVLDSGRSDVQYEEWRGHKLDRQMLNLLQEYSK
jgi:endoglucanase